jgi:uncharacterized protein YjbI with pentapeptide repeats
MMPEQPAQNDFDRGDAGERIRKERLATPEELAEFGRTGPDPETEARILALFEDQLVEAQAEAQAESQPVPEGPLLEKTPGVTVEGALEISLTQTQSLSGTSELTVPRAAEEKSPAEASAEPPLRVEEVAPQPAVPPTEVVPQSYATHSHLLEFAEVLDQHRVWVESGGKEGIQGDLSGANLNEADLTGAVLQGAQMQKVKLRGADLSMANLRNANLVEADLRDTNLLGTEFSGANMMGANFYGAQGLWAGRLGGTNLFDATLPEAVGNLNAGQTIAQFTQTARRFYGLLMALCTGAIGLIAMTTDVRLLLDGSALRTSRIPNMLPLQGFYLGAPLLLTVFYLRLQFLLLRLWGSVGAMPAVFPDGQTPEKDGRWYLMGPIRPHLAWSRDPRSPLGMVESYVAMALAHWAVPAVLFLFWMRYLVLQDYRGTLLHVFLFAVACAAACAMPRVVARVLRPGDWTDESTPHFLRDVLLTARGPALAAFVLFLLSLGVIRGLPSDPAIRPEVRLGDPRRWAATAFQSVGFRPYADITEESLSAMPPRAETNDTPAMDANGPRMNEMSLRYARGYHAAFANARMWRANLEGTNLAEADFRGANLRESNLQSAHLDRVRAERANLVSADAQGAVLAGGDFRNTDMSYANLEGATLSTANVSRATMYAVNLRHANLLRAELSHADLRDTKLEEAVLSLATLEQTDLSAAKLKKADLTGAQFKGTILLEADLSQTDMRGAAFPGAVLREARLDGANLLGADLRGALGLEAWQVCSAQGWRGAQLDPDVKAAVLQNCGTTQAAP